MLRISGGVHIYLSVAKKSNVPRNLNYKYKSANGKSARSTKTDDDQRSLKHDWLPSLPYLLVPSTTKQTPVAFVLIAAQCPHVHTS